MNDKLQKEFEKAQKDMAAMLRCIRNSANSLLERLEKGEKISVAEIDFEFSGKLQSAIIAATRAEAIREMFNDAEVE